MKWLLFLTCLGTSFFIAGCWDEIELNARAIVIGSALDLSRDGRIVITEQIVIPQGPKSSPGSTGQNFIVVSAAGHNWIDAFQNLQTKLSRHIYLSHRRTVYIGERLAKRGIRPFLDEFSRNPDSRLRTDLLIVRGAEAKEIMTITAPLERLPSFAAEGIRRSMGGKPGTSLLEFLIEAASETASPTAPAMMVEHHGVMSKNKSLDIIQFAGRAIFNKNLQLIGYLNYPEAISRFWVTRSLERQYMTVALPAPIQGYASLNFSTFTSRMTPRIGPNQRLSMRIVLGATATVIESNTRLDLKKRQDIRKLEKAMDRQVSAQTVRSIRRVQRQYEADIYGFDDACKRTFPKTWRTWKQQWPQHFARADVHVSCHVAILTTGATGSTLGMPETPPTNSRGGQ